MTRCGNQPCPNVGTVGIRTTHGGRDTDGLKTVVWTAEVDAPVTAGRYCRDCAIDLMGSIIKTMAAEPEVHCADEANQA